MQLFMCGLKWKNTFGFPIGKMGLKKTFLTDTEKPKLMKCLREGFIVGYIEGFKSTTGVMMAELCQPEILLYHLNCGRYICMTITGQDCFTLFTHESDKETSSNVKLRAEMCPKQVKKV